MDQYADALIGHTGLIGGTLVRSGWHFHERYNSRNIEEMGGRRFGTVVCAGVSAVKWKANKEPEADWAQIERLGKVLRDVVASRFVLISTVDVYPNPIRVAEDDIPDPDSGQPYGRHRLWLERLVAESFPNFHIVRLPAVFGDGLRKNALFDLLTNNATNQISPNGSFQWYPLRRLKDDLHRILQSDVDVVNVASEAVRMDEIVARFFPHSAIGPRDLAGAVYDMRTRHASLLGGKLDYHLVRAQVMEEIASYVSAVQARGGTP